MKKFGFLLGRTLLAAGTSLTIFVAVEAHQKMVDATPLGTSSTPTAGGGGSHDRQEAANHQQAAPSLTAVAPSTTRSPQSASMRQSLAISVGDPGARAQNIAENPNISYSEWRGASFPVEDFQSYTSPFGYRRSATGYNYQEFHYGLDMAAPQGSYIRNWWSGKVVEVSDDSNCGTSVVVESGKWLHIYCHMMGHVESSGGRRYMIDREGGVQIFEGQDVVAGQRIGRVGMTGRTTGPHLHWGLKYDDNWVDPALVLRAMYGNQAISRTSPATYPAN